MSGNRLPFVLFEDYHPGRRMHTKHIKLRPCRVCGSTRIRLWDCGEQESNVGGGSCKECNFSTSQAVSYLPEYNELALVWNKANHSTEQKIYDAARRQQSLELKPDELLRLLRRNKPLRKKLVQLAAAERGDPVPTAPQEAEVFSKKPWKQLGKT